VRCRKPERELKFKTKPYHNIIILLCICLSTLQLHAQFCGTLSPIDAPDDFMLPSSLSSRDDEVDTVGLAVWVIRNTMPVDDLYDQLEQSLVWVNEKFEPAGLHFFICEWHIENGDAIFSRLALDDLNKDRFQDHRLNVYLVETITDNGFSYGGLGIFPSMGVREDRYVSIIQEGVIYPQLIAHEFGHYYNLYHTHERIKGLELVLRSNCHTAGDMCCDTPADPGLGFHNMDGCSYTGLGRDQDGYYYFPLTDYIMSYAPFLCIDRFSLEQYGRMRMTRDAVYPVMADRCDDLPDITLDVELHQIEVDFLDTLTIPIRIHHSLAFDTTVHISLNWEGNAQGFPRTLHIDSIRLLADHSVTEHIIHTRITTGVPDGDKTLRIKIDANRQVVESDERNNEVTVSITIENSRFPDALLFPNPASNTINLYYRNEMADGDLQFEIVDMTGRLLQEYSAANWNNPYFTALPVESLFSGSYLLVLRDGRGEKLQVLPFVKL
jgi:hypothetical protein